MEDSVDRLCLLTCMGIGLGKGSGVYFRKTFTQVLGFSVLCFSF